MATKIVDGQRREMSPSEISERQERAAIQLAQQAEEDAEKERRKNDLKLLRPDAPMAQVVKALNILLRDAGGE